MIKPTPKQNKRLGSNPNEESQDQISKMLLESFAQFITFRVLRHFGQGFD
jgi:hypothetical protein